jgi:hypothetical protein
VRAGSEALNVSRKPKHGRPRQRLNSEGRATAPMMGRRRWGRGTGVQASKGRVPTVAVSPDEQLGAESGFSQVVRTSVARMAA